jgi:YHS domain-containing protein
MLEEFSDPVCGVMVTATNAGGWRVHRGKTLYFCSKEHMEIFDQDPDKYVSEGKRLNTGLSDESQNTKSY